MGIRIKGWAAGVGALLFLALAACQPPPIVARLKNHVEAFPGPVLLVHGDSHTLTVDQPRLQDVGRPYENFNPPPDLRVAGHTVGPHRGGHG